MACARRTKRGRVWYARYYDKSGKRQWKSLHTTSSEIAQKKLADLIEDIEKRELGWRVNPKPIAEYLTECLAICKAEHSPKTYRVETQLLNAFVDFLGVRFLHQVSAGRIEAYKVQRAAEVSPSTVNRLITVIKAFFNRAVQMGYIEKTPAQYVKRLKEKQRQIKYLSDVEVKKLLKVCSPRVGRMVTVFLLTGLRLGELAHLRWKDVDFRHNAIHVQNQENWSTKNYKPRVIPMHPAVLRILQAIPNGTPDSYIFATRSGKTIESYIRWEILEYAQKAEVHANVKMFRATFASNLVMRGVDIYTVSKLLGHHDVKITEKHYAHLTPDFLGHSVSRLREPSVQKMKAMLN